MIKEIIYDWKTKGLLKKKPKKDIIDFDKAKNIGLLFDSITNYKSTKKFIESLTEEGKTVQILIKTTEKEAANSQYFTEKECKWYGKIASSSVQSFTSNAFDYLFLLNDNPHYLTEHIFALCNAKCSVGIHNPEKEDFYDLMFENSKNESIDGFYKTVKGYLDKIKVA